LGPKAQSLIEGRPILELPYVPSRLTTAGRGESPYHYSNMHSKGGGNFVRKEWPPENETVEPVGKTPRRRFLGGTWWNKENF